MNMKTILVPMEKHDGMQSVLQTALLLVEATIVTSKGFRCVGRLWPLP